MVTASAGTPSTSSSIDMMMVADPGTPGAPMVRAMMETASDTSALGGTGTPNAFASVRDCTAIRTHMPSMLSVAPRGIEKR